MTKLTKIGIISGQWGGNDTNKTKHKIPALSLCVYDVRSFYSQTGLRR